MLQELEDKSIFLQAQKYAFDYIDKVGEMDVFPSEQNLQLLKHFDEPMPETSTPSKDILEELHTFGSPTTVAQTGSRYFGFVNGNSVPAVLAVKWLADVWDQNGGLYFTSPINSKLEEVCQQWLREIFNLPKETIAAFVSGTSMANLCGVATARYQLLHNMGWNIYEKGLYGAPRIRIIAHTQVHSSIKKTLGMLGFGRQNVEWIPSDNQGRLILEELPKLDSTCLVLLQAGNANTGSFDHFDVICDLANEVGAWVHIDGAFGLWAAASNSLSHLTKGIQKADSWAVDGHKTLNTPYDSGIAMCKHPKAMMSAMQATGEYLIYSEHREPMLYGPEMSKRSRAIELWATMKYLGKQGIDDMVTDFYLRSKQLEKGLRALGFEIVNEVVFNQVMVATKNETQTKRVLEYLQNCGECWLGGSTWEGRTVIRVSTCQWRTDEKDIERLIGLFAKGLEVSV